MGCSLALEHYQHKKINVDLPYVNQEAMRRSANALFGCYEHLSMNKQHLLFPLLGDASPKQWTHYPENDVIDHSTGYQYFYHSHSPEDRQDSQEHGHFHLFARMDGGKHDIDAITEAKFLDSLKSVPDGQSTNANLLCISLDPKGVPMSMFTVNRWVTEDHLLSASTTLALLNDFRITTPGFEIVNQWLEAILGLFWPEIIELLLQRDLRLAELASERHQPGSLLEDKNIELLSETVIDIDYKISLLNQATESTD